MRKIPIWDFIKISKGHYLSLPRDQKLELMKHYIQAMRNELNGELFIYLFGTASKFFVLCSLFFGRLFGLVWSGLRFNLYAGF